jgi:hypothetical protein
VVISYLLEVIREEWIFQSMISANDFYPLGGLKCFVFSRIWGGWGVDFWDEGDMV